MQKLVGIVIITAIEAVSILAWFDLMGKEAFPWGYLILLSGLIVEHVIAFNVSNGRSLFNTDYLSGSLLALSATEATLWVLWMITVHQFEVFVGFVFLSVGMFFQHNLERNVFQEKPLFSFWIRPETLGFTFVKAVAASAWIFFALYPANLGLLPAGILTVGLLFEHTIQMNTR